MRKIILTILIVVALTHTVYASTITFTEGHHTWTDNDPYYEAIILDNDASLDYSGGWVNMLDTYNTSLANITGGIITHLRTSDESIIYLHENINMDILEAKGDSIINLYTDDFTISSENGRFDYGYIEGTYYSTTTDFFIHFYNNTTYSHLNIVPEPTTFLLFALGGLAIRKHNF